MTTDVLQADHLIRRLAYSQKIARIGNWERNIRSGNVWWSDTAREIFGFGASRGPFTLRFVLQRLHPDDRERVKNHIEHAIRTRTDIQYETRVLKPGGYVSWVSVIGEVVTDDFDTPIKTQGVVRDITVQKAYTDAMIQYQDRLRALAQSLSQLEDANRREFSIFLHDEIGSRLVGARMMLNAVIQDTKAHETEHDLVKIKRGIDEVLALTEEKTFAFSSPMFENDDWTLSSAIEKLARMSLPNHKLKVSVANSCRGERISKDVCFELYRSTREVFENIKKHAKCTVVSVRCHSDQQNIYLEVGDNGVGFELGNVFGSHFEVGFGLFSISEGMRNISGDMIVESDVGHGASVKLVAPIAEQGGCRVL